MNKLTLIFFLCFLIFSCNNDSSSKTSKTNNETCKYSVNTDELIFEWVAFKTTEKLAVKGSFDDVSIQNTPEEDNIPHLIIQTNFEISLQSVNSGNEERDEKLRGLFFQNLANPDVIAGAVEECDGDNEKGKAIINLLINEKSHQVMMNYKVEDETLKLHGGLDLLNWSTEKSLDSLHKACLDLHKGKDGVSKTWSTMEINIHLPLIKQCK